MVIEYSNLPAIVTMEEAIAADSFHSWPNDVRNPLIPTYHNVLFR